MFYIKDDNIIIVKLGGPFAFSWNVTVYRKSEEGLLLNNTDVIKELINEIILDISKSKKLEKYTFYDVLINKEDCNNSSRLYNELLLLDYVKWLYDEIDGCYKVKIQSSNKTVTYKNLDV